MNQPVFIRLQQHDRRAVSAFSLLEGMIATMLVVVFMSSIFVLSSQTTGLLRRNKETAAASQNLQERLELLRRSNWKDLTSPAYVGGSKVLLQPTTSGQILPVLTETITVTPFYPPGVATPSPSPAGFRVSRSGVSQQVAVQTGTSPAGAPSLKDQRMVRVEVDLSWQGMGQSTRTLQSSTVIAQGGVLR